MIGYILIGIGTWLVLDDWQKARDKKTEGGQDGIHKNGNDSGGSHSAGKSGTVRQESDRDRRVTTIGVPVTKTKGGQNGVSKKPVHKVKPDQDRNITGDNSTGKPDTTPVGDQGKSLKELDKHLINRGGQDAGSENNHENDACDNGDDVGAESSGRDESDGTKIDQGDGSSAGD